MSDEFLLSLRHSLHHLYDVARTLSWLHFLPLTLLSVVIFLLPGCGDNHGNTTDPVRTVRYVVVGSAQTLPALERTGEIHAHDETILSFRTGGRIVTRSVDIGDRVNAGQLLATLENTTSQNQLDGAQADYEGAKASAQVAALNLNRMQKLMPTGAIARTQLDTARADWLVARARLKNSESALRNARESLGWTRLMAPQSGVINEVSASAGQVVSGGQSVLTLATGEARDVVFDIAKPDAIPPQEQAGLRVSLLSDPSVQASVALRDISPQADPCSGDGKRCRHYCGRRASCAPHLPDCLCRHSGDDPHLPSGILGTDGLCDYWGATDCHAGYTDRFTCIVKPVVTPENDVLRRDL